MQEPFQLLPVVWLIHDDVLGQHLRNYPESHLSIANHIEDWRAHFNACTYVVFPDNHLPVCAVSTLYSEIIELNMDIAYT
jgi:hypothetical protein